MDRFELTPIQAGMLVEGTISARPGVNVEQVVCWFDDETIDPQVLEQAWHQVQLRHPSLRTGIDWTPTDGDEPVQEVYAEAPMGLAVEDWTGVAAPGDEVLDDAVARWLASDRAAGIAIDVAPAMRAALLVFDTTRSLLVWTFHHALLDGRSFTLVLQEVLETYDSFVAGVTPTRPASPPSFRSHVEAVRRTDRSAARAFFVDLLAGFDEPTPLPAEPAPPRPVGEGITTDHHAEREHQVPADVVADLEACAARSGATLGTMVTAAWAILLSRTTDRADVVFGTTRSGRHTIPDADQVVGCLINTVPMRVQPEPDRSVDDLVAEIRDLQVRLRPHEHTSVADVQSWSQVPPTVPLLSTNLVFERYLLGRHFSDLGGGWTHRRVEVREQTGFPLGLAVYHDDGLVLRLEYDTHRFRRTTVDRLLVQLDHLFHSLAQSTEHTLVGHLHLLGAAERDRLVDGHNPPSGPAAARSYLHEFETRAAADPDAVAVTLAGTDGATSLTYGELDQQSNQLARHLLSMGASADHPVGICLHRSVAYVVAMIAVLKTGGPYLPLDPTYPLAALTHMVENAGAAFVVTTSALASRLPSDGRRFVRIDDPDETARIAEQPDQPPDRVDLEIDLDRPAYVIYTSGSTGTPKGVVVSHRALADFTTTVADHYELTPDDRVLQFSSLSFDVSIEEILPTFLRGATLVLRTDELAESMPALVEMIEREKLTVLNVPTAFWHALVEALHEGHHDPDQGEGRGPVLSPSVRLVVTGGEKVSRAAYDQWRVIAPEVRWLNGYGPTETTVTCTIHEPARRAPLGPGDELPIGRPMAHARAYVLGGGGQWLMPEGAIGELWIGGSGVALGYLGQPTLTAERFRPDPFTATPGARMYRTGDLARWNADGDLEFHGRADRQIKLRGFRIEPGEVEAALEGHELVRTAYVALRPGAGGVDQLVAWVVPTRGAPELDDDEIRRSVASVLPAHAVPTTVVPVTRLVHTAGGKVDLDALPVPHLDTVTPVERHDAPTSAAVDRLVEHFSSILDAPDPGPDTSFFDLGGHSLLALRLLSRIERTEGVRLSLATLHDAPTPRLLSAALDAAQFGGGRAAEPAYLVPIQPAGHRAPLFGVHVLGTNACYYRPLATHLGLDQPVFGLSIADPHDDTPTAVEAVAALYLAEIQRSHPEGPVALAAVSMGGYVAFELAQQLTAAGRTVSLLALFDAPGPGGRPEVGRLQRIRIHLGQLRAIGPAYLNARVEHVRAVMRERADARRLRSARSRGTDTPEDLWMHRFVMANVRAADEYRAQPYAGRLMVVRATGELFDAPESAANALGWSPVATGQLEVVEVPGTHMEMLQEPVVAQLAAALREALDQDDENHQVR